MTTNALETRLFIGGQFTESSDGSTFATNDPATGERLADVSHATADDVRRAVASARSAQREWSGMAIPDRARVLRRTAELIERDAERLALLESRDAGKPIRDSRVQVLGTAVWFDYFADIAAQMRSDVIPSMPGHLNYTLRQPIGVVATITPWNYPMPLYGIKLPAALAVGNAVVLKPAEQTPLTALALAGLMREAGLPDGVLSVLPGLGETTGAALVESQVDMISFTGSTDVGRKIAARAGERLIKVTLELGGKSPSIVFADSDLEMAADGALFTFCVHQGQLCSAGTRLLVESSVKDEFVGLLVERAEALHIGNPLDETTQLGAVMSPEQMERIESYVGAGIDAGARPLTGGSRARVTGLENGLFYRPTIFDGVESNMRIAQEEIFGPVLSVLPFGTDDQAVELANDVMYGLAAGIWTTDLRRAHRFARDVDAGIVYVNTMNLLAPWSPYSGWKQSGLGVEGGIEQAESFTRLKSVWVNLGDDVPRL
ncbi:MAG: aldehyde dehydrogenase family protein [Acidimicrobiia bacterium]